MRCAICMPSRALSSPPATTRRSITAIRFTGRTARRCRRNTPIEALARIRANRYEDAVEMDEAEAKAKGLLQIIGNKEVDDDYIAQVKTLSVQPELMKTAGKELKIVYTPIHGSGNKPVRAHSQGNRHRECLRRQGAGAARSEFLHRQGAEPGRSGGVHAGHEVGERSSARTASSARIRTATAWALPSRMTRASIT